MKQLTQYEIRDRLIRFNETNDWSVFDDVPSSQQVNIMYPHMLPATLQAVKEQHKRSLKEMAPEPPKTKLWCDACGNITDTGHTSWMCRFVIWLTKEQQ